MLMSNSSVFRVRLNPLKLSAGLQLYDSEFQTEGVLTLKAFANKNLCCRDGRTISGP